MDTNKQSLPNLNSIKSDIRADLIKRLFAVAISVGFATTLVGMSWVKSGSIPTYAEAEQLAALLTALLATVASWDGYLVSIQSKPLQDTGRFWTDIALVFIYMFLLISASHPTTWLPTMCVIFALYVLWDMLSINEYQAYYWRKEVPLSSAKAIGGVYIRGLFGKDDVSPSPIITLYWLLYFIVLLIISPPLSCKFSIFVTCGSAAIALLLYRHDKMKRNSKRNLQIIASIFALLLATHLVYKFV